MKTSFVKNTLRAALLGVAVLTAGQALAIPITGSLNFSGATSLNGTTATATAFTDFFFFSAGDAIVTASGGNYSGIVPGTTFFVNPNPGSPFVFSVNAPYVNLFTVSGFTFSLTSISVVEQTAGLNVTGLGFVSGNGYDPTFSQFNIAVTEFPVGTTYTYAASLVSPAPSVPDGGVTAILLGVAMIGVVLVRRKLDSSKA